MAFNLAMPMTMGEPHEWGCIGDFVACARCCVLKGSAGEGPCPVQTQVCDARTGAQRAGTRPHTVEVGMVLCRPADGVGASAWRVESVRAGLSAVLVDREGIAPCVFVAVAAIKHEDGGWVLAEDWTAPAEGEGPR